MTGSFCPKSLWDALESFILSVSFCVSSSFSGPRKPGAASIRSANPLVKALVYWNARPIDQTQPHPFVTIIFIFSASIVRFIWLLRRLCFRWRLSYLSGGSTISLKFESIVCRNYCPRNFERIRKLRSNSVFYNWQKRGKTCIGTTTLTDKPPNRGAKKKVQKHNNLVISETWKWSCNPTQIEGSDPLYCWEVGESHHVRLLMKLTTLLYVPNVHWPRPYRVPESRHPQQRRIFGGRSRLYGTVLVVKPEAWHWASKLRAV